MSGGTHGRRQSCVPTDGMQVLFDGSKTFWKTRSNLDILIVSHSKQLCIEIIAYDADAGIESPRMYCSSMQLYTSLDKEELDRKLSAKKEAVLRQRKTVNAAELQKEVANEMMVQYIMTRLNVVVPALGEEADSIKVVLTALSGDAVEESNPQQLQAMMECPTALVKAIVNYQKKATLKEMSAAMYKLNGETLALQQATRMAELVTSSVDGFKLMLAEKMRIDAEMKATFTAARLRWVRAITRVLIQNYIAKLHIRLLNSGIRDWYIKIMEAAAAFEEENSDISDTEDAEKDGSTLGEAPPESSKQTTEKIRESRAQRNKHLRRSLDNSQLVRQKSNGTQFPILGGGKNGGTSPTSASSRIPILPSLSQSGSSKGSQFATSPTMERRRQERAGHVGMNGKRSRRHQLRRSFDDVASCAGTAVGSMATSPSSVSVVALHDICIAADGSLVPPNKQPPSLRKSYSDMIPRLETPVSLSAFGDVSRSLRLKRMMDAK